MNDPKRLTDKQIAEIKARADWASGLPAGVVSAEKSIADRAALLTHCEALLAEIAELKTRMAEGFSAREGQVENGAKMIANLMAENVKLRKRLIDAKPILEGFAAKNPRWPKLCNGEIVMQDPAGVFSLLSFIDTLEPAKT